MNRLGDHQASDIERPYPYQQAGGVGETMSAVDFLSILRRRFLLIVAVVIAMTALSWLVASHLTPQYRAEALVLLDEDGTDIISDDTAPLASDRANTVIETQMRVLQSRSFAEMAVDALDLTRSSAFNPALRKEDIAEKSLITQAVDEAVGFVSSIGSWKLLAATDPSHEVATGEAGAGASARDGLPEEEKEATVAMSILLGSLQVARQGQSTVIAVSYKSAEPELSAGMANKIARLYVESRLTNKGAAADRAAGWLKKRVDELRERVIESEDKIAAYRAENKLVQASRLSLDDQQIADLSSEMIKTKALVSEQRAKLDLIQKASENRNGLTSISEVMNSSVIGALREEELL